MKTLSVAFGDSSPKGRAKELLQIRQHGAHRRVCRSPRLPLVTKGSCRRRRLMRSEGRRFAERQPVVRQNVHLLIPSVTASPCHRLAAARSRRGSDSPPGCHSMPRRRFATLVTKGRLWCVLFRIGVFQIAIAFCAGGAEPRPYVTTNFSVCKNGQGIIPALAFIRLCVFPVIF